MQQEHNEDALPIESELSDVWKELLNYQLEANSRSQITSTDATIPTLESDPWSALLQAKGVEIVDLHMLHLQVSDQDVEQALQIMQEPSAHNPE